MGWFIKSLKDTTRTSAMIMLLVAGAMVLDVLSQSAGFLLKWRMGSKFESAAFYDNGCYIDNIPYSWMFYRCAGIGPSYGSNFLSCCYRCLGYNPIWFGVITVLVVAMGVITPPVGMNVFIIKGVAKDVPLETIFKGVWPFIIAIFACIALLIIFPQIAIFLPNMLK